MYFKNNAQKISYMNSLKSVSIASGYKPYSELIAIKEANRAKSRQAGKGSKAIRRAEKIVENLYQTGLKHWIETDDGYNPDNVYKRNWKQAESQLKAYLNPSKLL